MSETRAALDALRQCREPETVVTQVENAFVHSARIVAFIATGFVLLGFLASFRLPQSKRDERDDAIPADPRAEPGGSGAQSS